MTHPEQLAQQAIQALKKELPEEALELLESAVALDRRPDLLNALGVVHLQLGNAERAKPLLREAVDAGWEHSVEPEVLAHYTLAVAAACEDLDQPEEALAAYDQVFEVVPGNTRAQAGRGNLLLGMGRLEEARSVLSSYLSSSLDEQGYLDAARSLLEAVDRFLSDGVDPRLFLRAHRESYCAFFDEKASEMEEQGWMAECARMMRAQDGSLIPSIPEGAQPYAAVRVDLVDPSTGRAGQVGDQPMVVALAGYEALGQAPVVFRAEGELPLWVSSQCPWDQLPISLLLESGDALSVLEPVLAEWYCDGFNGSFGETDRGRFHYISDPAVGRDGCSLTVYVDLGRARLDAVDGLLNRLSELQGSHPLRQILLGRGHLG